jgi:phosphatidylglycerol---prolipoprotein diacylglyceryl transferase
MYPNLYFFLKDTFGINPPQFTQFINSFGVMLSLSFAAAAYTLYLELKRKSAQGWFTPKDEKITIGAPASYLELGLQFLIGFLLGYKFLGLFISKPDDVEVQDYIMSIQGNLLAGLGIGGLFVFLRYMEAKKQLLPVPEQRTIRIWPQSKVGDITMMAAFFGLLGAKVFHNLENWNQFIAAPLEALTSFSGLTFYGGLIVAAIAIIWYLKKQKISLYPFLDAVAPGLILAYAIGRIGCQISGDGDWGVFNSAYKIDEATNKVVAADPKLFDSTVAKYASYFSKEYKLDAVPHKAFKGPDFLPNWMFAYTYPNNVLGYGDLIPGNTDKEFNTQIPAPVFPTPLYETVMGLLIFLSLWLWRKKASPPGKLFAVYLILNGMERFLIERIRVNTTYDFSSSFQPTQAQLISFSLIILGAILYFYFSKRNLQKGEF